MAKATKKTASKATAKKTTKKTTKKTIQKTTAASKATKKVTKAPAKKEVKKTTRAAPVRKKVKSKGLTAKELETRIFELYKKEKSDAEIFHETSLLLKQSVGHAFFYLFQNFSVDPDGMDLRLIGANETDLSYYVTLEEMSKQAGFELAESFVKSVNGTPGLLETPDELPLYGIEKDKLSFLEDIKASSVILVPLLGAGEVYLGAAICCVQEPTPHYSENDAEVAGAVTAPLREILLKRNLLVHQSGFKTALAREEKRLKDLQKEREEERTRLESEIGALNEKHASELSRLNQEKESAIQSNRTELEEQKLNEVNELKTNHEARLKELADLLENQSQDTARLKQEREADVARLQKEKEEETARLKQEREADVARLQKEKENEITALKAERDSQLADLQKERTEEVTRLKQEKESEITSLKEDRDAEIARLKQEGEDKELAWLEAEDVHKSKLSEIERRGRNEATRLTEENRRIVEDLKNTHEREKIALQAAKRDETNNLTGELQTLREKHARELQTRENEYTQTLNAKTGGLKASMDKQSAEFKSLLEEKERAHASKLQSLEQKLESTRQNLTQDLSGEKNRALASLKDEHENELLETLEKHDNETKKLNDIISNLKNELEGVRGENSRAQDDFEQKSRTHAQQLIQAREEREQAEQEKEKSHKSAMEALREDQRRERERLQASLDQKFQTAEAKYTQELNSLKSNLDSQDRSSRELNKTIGELRDKLSHREGDIRDHLASIDKLNQEIKTREKNLNASEERARQNENELRKEIQELGGHLSQEKSGREKENKEHQDLFNEISRELEEANKTIQDYKSSYEETRNTYERKLKASEEKLQGLKETLEKERITNNKKTVELNARIEGSRRQLQQKETDLLEQIHHLNQSLENKTREVERLSKKLPELEEELRVQLSHSETQKQALEKLQNEHKNLFEVKTSLDEQLTRLQKQSQEERALSREEARNKEEEYGRELESIEKRLGDTDSKLKGAETRIVSLQRELDSFRTRSEKLAEDLDRALKKEKELQKNIQDHKDMETELNKELDNLSNQLGQVRLELKEAGETEKDLKNQIGIQREREARLEQAIASQEEEKRNLKNKIANRDEEASELKRAIDGHLNSISELKSELAELYGKEKKLIEELNVTLARERGSKETGALLAGITNAISNISGLPEKLQFLKRHVNPGVEFERVLLYSLMDEEHLKFEDGFWNESSLTRFKNLRIPMRETPFGQSIASGKPQHLGVQKNIKMPDLPELLVQEINALKDTEENWPDHKDDNTSAYILVPLREADKVIGLITFASSDNSLINEDKIRLMEQISPLIAASLRYEQNKEELSHYRSTQGYSDHVSSYLEGRFFESIRKMGQVVDDLPRIREPELPESILADIESLSRLPIPGRNGERTGDEFKRWLEELGRRAETGTGISLKLDIHDQGVDALREHIGPSFRNLFWISKEAVDNVIQHSQANNLEITLDQTPDEILFRITDDGEGLVRTAGTDTPRNGAGLKAIKNLTANTGGKITFGRAANGYGLSVNIIWSMKYKDSMAG